MITPDYSQSVPVTDPLNLIPFHYWGWDYFSLLNDIDKMNNNKKNLLAYFFCGGGGD